MLLKPVTRVTVPCLRGSKSGKKTSKTYLVTKGISELRLKWIPSQPAASVPKSLSWMISAWYVYLRTLASKHARHPKLMTTHFSKIRRDALRYWKSRSKRVFKTTDNFSNSVECEWQRRGWRIGYAHISIFCSIGQFASHITDLLRDYRYDKYDFDADEDVNEIIFRFYSRVLLIASEILTDFQDLYILADNKISAKQLGGLRRTDLKDKQNKARLALSGNTKTIQLLLDYINKVCKHKISNIHLCNNHIKYLFIDYHTVENYKKRIEVGNIKNFTAYDPATFKRHVKPDYIVLPSLHNTIDIIINGYVVLDKLFEKYDDKFRFICDHYNNK